jgi:hypothetical protein
MSYKGSFKPKHPEKYKGDPNKIIYRSSWERKVMNFLDQNDQVLEWASEEFSIPYRSPLDGELHRYFPDFWVKTQRADGKVEISVIEVKPHKENPLDENGNVKPLPQRGKNKLMRYYLKEVARWGVNEAKFQAATAFCEDRGWVFKVLTEKDILPSS